MHHGRATIANSSLNVADNNVKKDEVRLANEDENMSGVSQKNSTNNKVNYGSDLLNM